MLWIGPAMKDKSYAPVSIQEVTTRLSYRRVGGIQRGLMVFQDIFFFWATYVPFLTVSDLLLTRLETPMCAGTHFGARQYTTVPVLDSAVTFTTLCRVSRHETAISSTLRISCVRVHFSIRNVWLTFPLRDSKPDDVQKTTTFWIWTSFSTGIKRNQENRRYQIHYIG